MCTYLVQNCIQTFVATGAPVLTTIPPVSAVVSVGNSIVLPCSAVGSPEPQITWYKDGRKISSTHRHYIFLEGSSDLKIINAAVKDQGNYVCRASNKQGFVSASTELSVHGTQIVISCFQIIGLIFSCLDAFSGRGSSDYQSTSEHVVSCGSDCAVSV